MRSLPCSLVMNLTRPTLPTAPPPSPPENQVCFPASLLPDLNPECVCPGSFLLSYGWIEASGRLNLRLKHPGQQGSKLQHYGRQDPLSNIRNVFSDRWPCSLPQDRIFANSFLGDVACAALGLTMILWIRISGIKLAKFWPAS